MLRALLRDTPYDHGRFILYGLDDVLVSIFGTDADNDIWLNKIAESQFPVEQLPITTVLLYKGHTVVPAAQELDISEVKADDVNRFIRDYESQEQRAIRDELRAKHILLGPSLVENLVLTNRLIAFVMIDFGGRIPIDRDHYVANLLKLLSVQEFVRSIYVCGGRYNLVLEVICNTPRDLDRLTEDIQTDSGSRYSIESVTYIVASIEKDELPLIPVSLPRSINEQKAMQETDVAFEPINIYVQGKLGLTSVSEFRDLSVDRKLFLAEFFGKVQSFDTQLLSGESLSDWQEALDSLVRGYISESTSAIKGAVAAVARIVEGVSKAALIKILDIFFEANYGEAQRRLKLPNTNIDSFELGKLEEAFGQLKRAGIADVLGLSTIDEELLRSYSVFRPARNEFIHDPMPARYQDDFTTFTEEVRQAFHHGMYIVRWLNTHVLIVNWQEYVIDNMPRFFSLLRVDGASVETQNLVNELQILVQESAGVISGRLNAIEASDLDIKRSMDVLYDLTTLLCVETARKKTTREYTDKLYRLVKYEGILESIQDERLSGIETWIIALNTSRDTLKMNVVAALIWYFLLSTRPDRFTPVMQLLI